ncbi:SbmA/BacA-like family transporter [Candidatus Deianiraea vastatrix]|uniref:ABC transporter ATP-binding protein n=1 Tax=Candidatus Deianiraea vastatrix TaxID=2163644 RepID=A0A5B8XG87_9RICK|nr:SbmA/BacA-like family transporter [Candidatus Deianiraea vastatrix]QED23896.1 ABC transporter ATP-binding protein [Candidatus Deianiraea vastatrix]
MTKIFTILKHGMSKNAKIQMTFVIFLSIMAVACLVCMNCVYGWFYDSLVNKNSQKVIANIALYFALMITLGLTEAEMHYRKRMFTSYFRKTIYNYYNIYVLNEEKCKFSCQRMSQDLLQFGTQFINLFALLLHSILLIPSFLYVLITLKIGYLTLAICIIVTILASIISKKIGHPVVKLQYNQESLEGGLRRDLIDQTKLTRNKTLPDISSVLQNYVKMSKKERLLMYFKNTYDKISHAIPYTFLVPRYIAAKITLGQMVQMGTGLSKLLTEISFIVNNIDKIVEFDATVARVKELDEIRQNAIIDFLDNKITD